MPRWFFRANREIIVPVNARRFLTITEGEMRIASQDVYVSEGVGDYGGGRHIPPEDLGVIRWVGGGPVFDQDREAYDAILAGEQGFEPTSKSLETLQIIPKELCKVVYIDKKADEEEEEDVSSPDSVAPAAFAVEVGRAQARKRIVEILCGTRNRACPLVDLQAIKDRECGVNGQSPYIEEIDRKYTEACRNVKGDEYDVKGEMMYSAIMNKVIEDCVGHREVCETDDADHYKTDRLFELRRVATNSALLCDLGAQKSPNGFKVSKLFMKNAATSFFGCVVAAFNPDRWNRATLEQREIWTMNCMKWCKKSCSGAKRIAAREGSEEDEGEYIVTSEIISAISDLIDADIAVEDVVLAKKTVYKSAHTIAVDENTERYYRTRALIQVGMEVREGEQDGAQVWNDSYFLIASSVRPVDLGRVGKFNARRAAEEVVEECPQQRLREETARNYDHQCPFCGLSGLDQENCPMHDDDCTLEDTICDIP